MYWLPLSWQACGLNYDYWRRRRDCLDLSTLLWDLQVCHKVFGFLWTIKQFNNIFKYKLQLYEYLFHIGNVGWMFISSVQNFGCPCARDNQKSRRTTKNTDAVIQQTTINFDAPAVKLNRSNYLVPCSDNQKHERTTRYCNLVVRGTTIYFSLIRTLAIAQVI